MFDLLKRSAGYDVSRFKTKDVIKMNGPRLMGWLRKRKEMTRLKRNMLVNGPWKHETDSKTGLLRRNGAQQCMRCIDGA